MGKSNLYSLPPSKEEERPFILGNVLQEVYEVAGLIKLGHFTVFFVTSVLTITLHWHMSTGSFKSAVVENQGAFGDMDWEQTEWVEVDSLASGIKYIRGYVGYLVAESDEIFQGQPSTIVIGQNSFIDLMILSISSPSGKDIKPLLHGNWTCVDPLYWIESGTECFLLLHNGETTREEVQDKNEWAYDSLFDRDAFTHISGVKVDMLVREESRPEVNVAMFRTNFFVHASQVYKVMLTYYAGNAMYRSTRDAFRAGCEVWFVIANVIYFRGELQQRRLSFLQYGKRLAYFNSIWNVVDTLSLFLNFLMIFWYIFILFTAPYALREHYAYDLPSYLDRFSELLHVNFYIYIGTLNNFLIGCRMFKYMKFHNGLRIYTRLFSEMWGGLRDFLVFYIFLIVLIASCLSSYFEYSGGNIAFSTYYGSLSSLLRLTFGFYDYEEFYNDGKGLGGFAYITVAVFWVAVGLAIVISQSVILAIVVNAYDQVRIEGNVFGSEVSFVTMSMIRVKFYLKRVILYKVFYRGGTYDENNEKLSAKEKMWYELFVRHAPIQNMMMRYFTDSVDSEIVKGELGPQGQQYAKSPWQDSAALKHKKPPGAQNVPYYPLSEPMTEQQFFDLLCNIQDDLKECGALTDLLASTRTRRSWFDRVFFFLRGSKVGPESPLLFTREELRTAASNIYDSWVNSESTESDITPAIKLPRRGSTSVEANQSEGSSAMKRTHSDTTTPAAIDCNNIDTTIPATEKLSSAGDDHLLQLPSSGNDDNKPKSRWAFVRGGQNAMMLEMQRNTQFILDHMADVEEVILKRLADMEASNQLLLSSVTRQAPSSAGKKSTDRN